MTTLLKTLEANEARIVLMVICISSVCVFAWFLFALIREECQLRKKHIQSIDSLLISVKVAANECTQDRFAMEHEVAAAVSSGDDLAGDLNQHRTKMRWLILPLLLAGMMLACSVAIDVISTRRSAALAAPNLSAGGQICQTYFG